MLHVRKMLSLLAQLAWKGKALYLCKRPLLADS